MSARDRWHTHVHTPTHGHTYACTHTCTCTQYLITTIQHNMTEHHITPPHPPLVVGSRLCHAHCTWCDGREDLSSPTSPEISLLAGHCQSLRLTHHSHCHHHEGTGRCPYTDSGGPPRCSALQCTMERVHRRTHIPPPTINPFMLHPSLYHCSTYMTMN